MTEEPPCEYQGKEISLAQHEYNISPKKKKKFLYFPEDDEEEGCIHEKKIIKKKGKEDGRRMTKWYCLCVVMWLTAIGLAAYIVPTYVLKKPKRESLCVVFLFLRVPAISSAEYMFW